MTETERRQLAERMAVQWLQSQAEKRFIGDWRPDHRPSLTSLLMEFAAALDRLAAREHAHEGR